MFDILSSHVLLTVFIVIALGTAFGAIPFGPVRFGAAGTLFVGLLVGSFVFPSGQALTVFQDLGLGLFVYTVGLESGDSFFKNIKKQFGMMVAAIISVTVAAAVAVGGAMLLGVSRHVALGSFAGSMTSTPSLALAQEITGTDSPAVGYALGYPTGVVVAILLVALTIGRQWKAKKDPNTADEQALRPIRIQVTKDDVDLEALNESVGDEFVLATFRRSGHAWVMSNDPHLHRGDTVMVMVTRGAQQEVIDAIGRRIAPVPFVDKKVTIQRFTMSNNEIAGHTVAEIDAYARFRARILRIRRADEWILANDDTHVEFGDLVEVAFPAKRHQDVTDFFGDSITTVSELDWIAAAGGLALGFLAALVKIPLPGGSSFALGAAAGPLIVGLVLGALHRTGRVAWQLPRSANYTLRQFGLMLFLASVGIASGPAFSSTAFSKQGLVAIALAALIALVGCGSFLVFAAVMGTSETRANGGVAGLLGQPAVLQYALANSSDSRIMDGYTATFTVALIYKILVVPFMLAV